MMRCRPTKDQEHDLIRRAQQGDDAAMETLLNAQEGVVRKYAAQILNFYTSHDYEDLVQEGRLAIHTAIQRFDFKHGGRLSTYVFHWMRAYLRKAQQRDPMIEIPFHLFDRVPYSERDTLPHVAASLDFLIGDGQDTTFADIIASAESTEDQVMEKIAQVECRAQVRDLLAHLNPHHRAAIWWSFGLDGHGRRTLDEVAQILGLSREGVRQRLQGAMRVLRWHATKGGQIPLPAEISASPIAKNRIPRAEIAALAAEGYTQPQIAKKLGINVASIGSALHRHRAETAEKAPTAAGTAPTAAEAGG